MGDLEIVTSYRVENLSIGQTHTSEFLGVSPYNGDKGAYDVWVGETVKRDIEKCEGAAKLSIFLWETWKSESPIE